MATFSDFGTISKDANFQARVQYALTSAAVNVYAESLNTAGHPLRAAFAQKVFVSNYNIQQVCLMVLTNATVSASANAATTPGFGIADADIQIAVNGLWNDFSGV